MTMNVLQTKRGRWMTAAAVLVAGAGVAYLTLIPKQLPVTSGPSVTRRLTAEQYQNIVADVFGGDIDLGGRFEPDVRVDGLVAVGASHVSVTATGMEQYDTMARAVASQALDAAHRESLLGCKPIDPQQADDKCAAEFLGRVGRLLYRRPLEQRQLQTYVAAAAKATGIVGDFYEGLSLSLSAMLSSPQFLFREEVLDEEIARDGSHEMDAYSKASQLSFFLWNSGPDTKLLDAAENGDLDGKRGLARQVDRMMASPRLEDGVRAFFIDQFRFDEFETLAKDPTLFPKFSAQIATDAREQTLRTVIDVVLNRDADYREIFTTRQTFLTPQLGAIYRVPIFKDGPNGSPDEWQPYEFPASDLRGGILTQVAFTALHSPAGRGSPTIRGKAVREVALCQKVPAPPGDVDFSNFEQGSLKGETTARERLGIHATNPTCAGCHKIMDPIGLALENFDGSGEFRTREGGRDIDPSGELDGIKYQNAGGLGQAVYENPAATACLVDRLSARALGRPTGKGERNWTNELKLDFADSGYRMRALMREIATSRYLYRVVPAATTPKPKQQIVAAVTHP